MNVQLRKQTGKVIKTGRWGWRYIQCFSNFNVGMNLPQILLKFRFSFRKSRKGPRVRIFKKIPGLANATGSQTGLSSWALDGMI